jgi:hypothetical protein
MKPLVIAFALVVATATLPSTARAEHGRSSHWGCCFPSYHVSRDLYHGHYLRNYPRYRVKYHFPIHENYYSTFSPLPAQPIPVHVR